MNITQKRITALSLVLISASLIAGRFAPASAEESVGCNAACKFSNYPTTSNCGSTCSFCEINIFAPIGADGFCKTP
jgi:hypothetical protein